MIIYNEHNLMTTKGFKRDVFVIDRVTKIKIGPLNDRSIILKQIASVQFDGTGLYIKNNTLCPALFDLLNNEDLILSCEVEIAGANAETFKIVNITHIFDNLQLKEIRGGFNTEDQFTYIFRYINL